MPGRPGAPAGKGTNQDQRMSGTCLVSFNDSSTHACHAGPSAYAAAVLSRVNIICPGCFSVFYHDKQKGIVCVCVCECVCVYAGCVCVVVCVCWVYPCKYYSAASAGLFIRYEKRTPPPYTQAHSPTLSSASQPGRHISQVPVSLSRLLRSTCLHSLVSAEMNE